MGSKTLSYACYILSDDSSIPLTLRVTGIISITLSCPINNKGHHNKYVYRDGLQSSSQRCEYGTCSSIVYKIAQPYEEAVKIDCPQRQTDPIKHIEKLKADSLFLRRVITLCR